MGDLSNEPSMEDILSSIKRIIAEEGDPQSPRGRRIGRAAPDPAILSARAAQATRGQLEALSRLIVKPETPGTDTLEGMVREMLKPMLSEWLDANLPRIVETMVAREIERIVGRQTG